MDNSTSNNIISAGYINGKKTGVFASLDAAADTTIVSANTYYAIAGTFTNAPIENFTAVADPAIRYDGALTQYFEVDWHASLKSNHNACTVTVGIKKNTNLVNSSRMATLCKTSGETYNCSGTCVIELAATDKIQLVVTSDHDNDILTFDYFTTSINEFFD